MKSTTLILSLFIVGAAVSDFVEKYRKNLKFPEFCEGSSKTSREITQISRVPINSISKVWEVQKMEVSLQICINTFFNMFKFGF